MDLHWEELKRGLGVEAGGLEELPPTVLLCFERWRRAEHHGLRQRLKAMLFTRPSVQERLTKAVRSGVPPNLRGTMWRLGTQSKNKKQHNTAINERMNSSIYIYIHMYTHVYTSKTDTEYRDERAHEVPVQWRSQQEASQRGVLLFAGASCSMIFHLFCSCYL